MAGLNIIMKMFLCFHPGPAIKADGQRGEIKI
jgi:hypothetical protein